MFARVGLKLRLIIFEHKGITMEVAAWIASFTVPFFCWLLIWSWLGNDAVTRIGYILWYRDWPVNDFLNYSRILTIRFCFSYLMPVLAGIVGLGWKALSVRRRAAKDGV